MIKSSKAFLYNLFLLFRYTIGTVKHYRCGVQKNFIIKKLELLGWWLKERDFNTMYYAMGLNLKGTNSRDFIGRREFLSIRNRVETALKKHYGCAGLDYDAVCKDKFVAGTYFEANGIPCAENLALIKDGRILRKGAEPEGLESFPNREGRFILKHITMEAGEGIHVLEINDKAILIDGKPADLREMSVLLRPGIWLLQGFMQSHEAIRKVNSSALNTTRIVTMLDGGEPKYLAGFQAFAVNGESTDSWGRGSICVGIDIERECLLEDGFYNLSIKDKSITAKHPDTGIVFRDYHIPHLKAAAELCIKAHKLLYFNFIVGWDVAITDDGPVIIEANEKPGMNVVQCFDGGLRNRILSAAKQIVDSGKEV